jgi:hypothetical protein
MDKNDRRIQAGEFEKVKASEEVTYRNVQSVIQFTNETRKMVLELRTNMDAIQNKMLALNSLLDENRKQLSLLQQQFYAKGTVSYND